METFTLFFQLEPSVENNAVMALPYKPSLTNKFVRLDL